MSMDVLHHARIQKVLSEGVQLNSDNVFLLIKGERTRQIN